MFYKCLECGHVFEDGEQATWEESRGEFWGNPCHETETGCPICHGEYEEAKCCESCGGAFLEDELQSGLCDDCFDELKLSYKYDIKKCFSLARRAEVTEDVQINSFLAAMYSKEQIEEILLQDLWIASANGLIDCTPFIDGDVSWFIDNARGAKK